MAENPHKLVLDKILVDQTTFNKLKQDEKFEDKVVIDAQEFNDLICMERNIRHLFGEQHRPFPVSSHAIIDRKMYENLKAIQSFVEQFKDFLFKNE
jgi:hypothetical protein